MNRTEIVRACIWLDQLAGHVKTERARLAAELAADARAEYEEQGTAPTWRIPDVATVSASVSHAAVYVADEESFTDWVAKRYPTEVETIQRIRSAWLADFLKRALGSVDVVADPDTGERVPGLGIRGGGQLSGISIRASAAAKEVFSIVARRGLERLAIEAGPDGPVVLAEIPELRSADA